MDPILEQMQQRTRRYFLQQGSLGLGAIAASSLLSDSSSKASEKTPAKTHFPAKAKRVIYDGLATQLGFVRLQA
jgi:hypothetical protein